MVNIELTKTAVTQIAGRGFLLLSKNAPAILTGGGIVGFIGTAVLASRATLKVEPKLDALKEVREGIENRVYEEPKDRQKDLAYLYGRTTIDLIKLYAPAVSLGVLSCASIIAGHGIMHKRNLALAAAFKVAESTFAEYRNRVVEELGEDKERDIRLGLKTETVEDEETGKKRKVVKRQTNSPYSTYAKVFDEHNPNWQGVPEYNRLFLENVQEYVNQKLHAQGYLFLNDVYRSLGFEETKLGCVTGWLLNGEGDGYIDFGMYDTTKEAARAFINGLEGSIFLDFNVDGLIYDKI